MPANSKKSRLILGFFTGPDLAVLGVGVFISAILLLIFKSADFIRLVLAVLPGAIAVLLVFPVPNYHNVMKLISNIFNYYTGVRKYEWKGWSVKDGK